MKTTSRLIPWLRAHKLAVLAMAAGIWLFGGIWSEVREGDMRAFDTRVLLAMRHPGDLSPLGPPAVQVAARDVTALGSATVLGLITLFTTAFFVLDGKPRVAWSVAGCVASVTVISTLLKGVFERPRPDIVPHEVFASSTSFPSGHSMMSAAVYLTLGMLLAHSHKTNRMKIFFVLLAVFLSFIIGVSRVYLGVHWPSDVLAGWTAGAVLALASSLIARRVAPDRGGIARP